MTFTEIVFLAGKYKLSLYRSSLLSGDAELKVSTDGKETVIFPKSVCSDAKIRVVPRRIYVFVPYTLGTETIFILEEKL